MTNILNQMAEKWFSWEVSMLWQAGLLIIIIAGFDLLIKKWAWPQVRYALWLLILVKLVLPPTLTSPTSFTAEIPFMVKQTLTDTEHSPMDSLRRTQDTELRIQETNPKPIQITEMQKNQQVEIASPKARNDIAVPAMAKQLITWKVYIFFMWMAGVAVLAGWLVIRLNGLRREHLKGRANLPERLEGLLASTAGKLGLKRVPQIILTNKVCCPAVFGVFRPVLLMPADKLQNMTAEDAENIFLHELAHIKRGDLFVHAIYMILQIAYWFNPLIWLIRKNLQNLRELCCDATVARMLKEKTAGYRQTLLETARQLLAQPVDPGLGLLGLFENSSWLLDRLHWLEKKSWRCRPLRIATVFILICVMSACVLPMTKYEATPDFVIKGTVTDAQTGKPIAGAVVGDVVTYAYGKYNTATDANGKYSYKTYYEEHLLKCRAEGYKITSEILLTKIFGKEKEKVINFQLKTDSTSDVEMLSVIIKVVNEEGKPVEGAEIKVDGFRDNWGHYSWDSSRLGPAPQVSTDAQGTARVICPKYAIERVKTKEISFSVRHQEYCSVRPYDYRVDGQSPPIILRKGATVKLSAYIGSKDNVITDIVPQVSGTEIMLERSSWKKDNDFLVTSQIPSGPHCLRAVYFPKDERIHFSDMIFFEARKGETSQFNLELKPGPRLEGKLDSSVPRPVQNGRVVVRAFREEEKNENRPLWWITYRTIKEDGTFVIESLPPGKVEIIAICDGSVSKNPSEDEKNVILHIGKPQIFEIKNDRNEVEIAMEPTATCQVTVLDDKGRPIKDATVAFAPNVEWGGKASQIFAQRYFDSEEFVRSSSKFDYKKQLEKYKTDAFAATTDEKGMAIVRNLPGYSANFEVVHSDYELPIKTNYGNSRREARAELSIGKTSTVTVTMQKKGKEFLVSDSENKRQISVCGSQIDPSREDMQILTGEKGEQGTLSGKVVDEKGNPLKGVLVDADPRHKGFIPKHTGYDTYTDANGYFCLSGLETEQKTVEIEFRKEGFTPKYIIKQPLGIKDAVIVLGNKTYFEGIVSDSDGKAVAGAAIKAITGQTTFDGYDHGEVPTECKSDKNGYYKLYVQADNYDIQVKAEQGVVRLPNVKIDKDEAKKLDLKINEAVTFLAKVIDSQTKEPVSGLRLSSWSHPEIKGTSDSNGMIQIPNMLPGKFEFWAESKESGRWWSEDCLSEWNHYKIDDEKTGWQRNFDGLDFDLKNGMEPVTIIVEKGVKIRGKVVDPAGNPVEGATVSLAKTGSGNSITGDTRYSYTTDANGNFEMMVPASKKAKYNLVAHDGKYEQWRNWANGVLEPIQTNPGDVIENVIIKLTEPATIKGTVVDNPGKAVANRQVRASAFDKLENRYYDPTSRTDTNGNFEIKFIRPGKHYIQADPFWLYAEQAPEGTSQIVTVSEKQILEGVKLIIEKPAGQSEAADETNKVSGNSEAEKKVNTARTLKVTIYEGDKKEPQTDINIPLTAVKILRQILPPKDKLQIIAQKIKLDENLPEDINSVMLIDMLDDMLKKIDAGVEATTLVEVKDGDERIIIALE